MIDAYVFLSRTAMCVGSPRTSDSAPKSAVRTASPQMRCPLLAMAFAPISKPLKLPSARCLLLKRNSQSSLWGTPLFGCNRLIFDSTRSAQAAPFPPMLAVTGPRIAEKLHSRKGLMDVYLSIRRDSTPKGARCRDSSVG